jgi:hypothetical protein
MKDSTSASGTIHVRNLLHKYCLPSAHELIENPPTKFSWKARVNHAIKRYWTSALQEDAKERSTLSFLNINGCEVGKPHLLYTSVTTSPHDVRRAVVKAQLLTGTYKLATRTKYFTKVARGEEGTCPLCLATTETVTHFLTECPVLQKSCQMQIQRFNMMAEKVIGTPKWLYITNNNQLTQFILDCTSQELQLQTLKKHQLQHIESLSRKLCFTLHTHRTPHSHTTTTTKEYNKTNRDVNGYT